jgi:phage shock protein E
LIDATAAHELTEEAPEGMIVLDVRTPAEHSEARLEGSVLIDFYSSDFENQLAGLDRDVPYFVYCRSGNRSAETVSLMKDLGFTEVFELEGGIQSWATEGLPLVSS